jgi:hypothetical protein
MGAGIFTKGINPGAYRGELTCPFVIVNKQGHGTDCGSRAIRYVEHVSEYRIRYRCRKCGNTFQYDISGRNDVNPYAPYQKGTIWKNIERVLSGAKLKGELK